MNLKRVSFGALALLVLVSCGKQQAAEGPVPSYPTQIVAKQNAELQSVYPVVIKGQEDIEIRPRIDGFIDAIHVDEGAVVRKGQALFSINSPQAEQQLLTAKASVLSAEAALRTAELNVEKTRPLAEKGIVSDYQLKTAQNAYDNAKATLNQAKAALQNAQATKSWATVTSPVDGIIGTIPFRQGSLVSSSSVLTTVANTSNVFVYFSINEKDLLDFLRDTPGNTQAEKIKQFQAVSLQLADGSIYSEKGKIETISGVVNETTGSASFRAGFANPQGLLRSGTSGKIVVPHHKDGVFVIPQKATFHQQDKVLVYKVQADSVVSTLISVLPMPDGQSYAVTNGLADGDRIVVDGIATLQPGKKIQAK